MPRFEINPLGTSDINYFEKLHNEIICPGSAGTAAQGTPASFYIVISEKVTRWNCGIAVLQNWNSPNSQRQT